MIRAAITIRAMKEGQGAGSLVFATVENTEFVPPEMATELNQAVGMTEAEGWTRHEYSIVPAPDSWQPTVNSVILQINGRSQGLVDAIKDAGLEVNKRGDVAAEGGGLNVVDHALVGSEVVLAGHSLWLGEWGDGNYPVFIINDESTILGAFIQFRK